MTRAPGREESILTSKRSSMFMPSPNDNESPRIKIERSARGSCAMSRWPLSSVLMLHSSPAALIRVVAILGALHHPVCVSEWKSGPAKEAHVKTEGCFSCYGRQYQNAEEKSGPMQRDFHFPMSRARRLRTGLSGCMEIAQWKNSNQRNQNSAFVWRERHLAYREPATL